MSERADAAASGPRSNEEASPRGGAWTGAKRREGSPKAPRGEATSGGEDVASSVARASEPAGTVNEPVRPRSAGN